MVGSTRVKAPYKILVTSALPYVNNIPHMGNIVGCALSADVFARYHRSQGNTTMFIFGTDEHGTATEAKALEEGLTPRQICDKYYAIHKQVYDWFEISYDIFGRTSAENHAVITQQVFQDLKDNGYIVQKDVVQAFCEKDQRFLADRFVEGECPHCHAKGARGDQCDTCGKLLDPLELINPLCKLCGNTPVTRSSTHLFLDLPKLQDKLSTWIIPQAKAGEWTKNAITTTEGWLKKGLEPRAITRDLSWGVPVPGMPGKVFYVWFDAPLGYISITAQQPDVEWRDWWQNPTNTRLYQFMGKDNVTFHTILFPATLIGTNKEWTLLHHIDAIEFLQHEDGKFSKSKGIGLFGDDAMETGIPADVFRYYLLINRPETSDTVFSWKDLQDKLNNELLANLGNLVNRTLVFIKNYQEGVVHDTVFDEVAANFWTWVGEEEIMITDDLEHAREKDALRRIMSICSKGNQYFQEQQPWKTRTEDPESCRRAMFLLSNLIKDVAILLTPYLPATSKQIFSQLALKDQSWSMLGELSLRNHRIGEPKPIFAKLEEKDLVAIKEKLAKKKAAAVPLKPLQLQVGRIVEVNKHPDASKLYVEQVDFGGELRTIVSGIAPYYREEDLRGKTAVFITNLRPAMLRGIESQGMILTAQEGEAVEVLFVDAPAGTVLAEAGEQITVDDFARHTLEAKDKQIFCDGKLLLVEGKPLLLKTVTNGKVR